MWYLGGCCVQNMLLSLLFHEADILKPFVVPIRPHYLSSLNFFCGLHSSCYWWNIKNRSSQYIIGGCTGPMCCFHLATRISIWCVKSTSTLAAKYSKCIIIYKQLQWPGNKQQKYCFSCSPLWRRNCFKIWWELNLLVE